LLVGKKVIRLWRSRVTIHDGGVLMLNQMVRVRRYLTSSRVQDDTPTGRKIETNASRESDDSLYTHSNEQDAYVIKSAAKRSTSWRR
jgi:hypothetical protein